MSALNLATRANPVFLSRNYLTRYTDQAGDLSVSSGTTIRHRLYDMDPAAQWQGENASDAIDESIVAGLWLPGYQSAQDVDFFAFLGHNLLAFDVDISGDNGATYPSANRQAKTAQAATYTLISLAATISADKIKVTAHTTQTAAAYKQIGAIVVAKALLQAPIGMSLFRKHPLRMRGIGAAMFDNSKRQMYRYRSDASKVFHDFTIAFSHLTEAQADAMEAILLGDDPFIFVPEPGDRPDEMWLGQAAPGTYTRDYMHRSKSGGEVVSFDFEEVGGA